MSSETKIILPSAGLNHFRRLRSGPSSGLAEDFDLGLPRLFLLLVARKKIIGVTDYRTTIVHALLLWLQADLLEDSSSFKWQSCKEVRSAHNNSRCCQVWLKLVNDLACFLCGKYKSRMLLRLQFIE